MVAMRDRFTKTGWRRVLDQTGEGLLTGYLKIDQVYAKYHHERLDLVHPRGGGPKYLEGPLFDSYQDYLARVGQAMLSGDPEREMAECMEALNTAMSSRAPIEFNNLRRSGAPRVVSTGRVVYRREAWQRRLTRQELNQLRRGRGRR
jgi:hypothetical protein